LERRDDTSAAPSPLHAYRINDQGNWKSTAQDANDSARRAFGEVHDSMRPQHGKGGFLRAFRPKKAFGFGLS